MAKWWVNEVSGWDIELPTVGSGKRQDSGMARKGLIHE
jgi:hypothetical protein